MNTILPSSIVIRRCVITALTLFSTSTLLLAPAAAQTAASDGENWELPLTSDGHPDLQGNWTNATLTPFERPENLGPVLTPEQVTALESGHADAVALRSEPSDSNRPLPPGGDDPVCIDGATTCYGEVWRDPGDRVAIVQGEPRSSLITDPVDGRVPPLTATTIEQIADLDTYLRSFGPYDHPELRPLAERCIVSFASSAGPPMVPNYWYNNNYTIVQTPDYVMIMAEMVHDVRIIRLGEPTSLGEDIRPWFGDSWGHWEGNTLVVETTNMNPNFAFLEVPGSDDGRVIERLTRVDEDTILYEFEIDDPTNYTSSWGGQIPFEQIQDPIYEYACHEGNYALANVLSGARYQEQRER
ncbi:MAG: hypothetical protein QGG67_08935 [Gammaproteobacteria bacterium]|jgi:hypothetical protein|nr:hypothetical protein [Gammaproteobacteria bacterium]HJO11447.1 hypothetical protein [Gammaproteobacteria bacterium]